MTHRNAIAISIGRIRHESIRAAAGSGKTHQLVSRFVQLIALGAKPDSILATTFTRLAAGEIRDRILQDLSDAALSNEGRAKLAERLGAPAVSAAQASGMLAGVVASIHLLQVRTLESFFASLVRAFAPELGLPVGAKVIDELEAAALRHEAVRLMLDERHHAQLVNVLRGLAQGGSDRSVRDTIDAVVVSMAEIHRQSPAEAWECVPEMPGRLSPPQIVDAIDHLAAIGMDHASKSLAKAWKSDLDQATSRRWENFIAKGIAGNLAKGMTTYGQTALDHGLIAAYHPLVDHAKAELVHRWRHKTIATRHLLDLYRVQEERLKQRRSALTFSDLTVALARAESLGTMEEIGFRLDAQLHHVLLDEFQDTSLTQWQALDSLVAEMVSVAPPERSFFCVGDAKQSIYTWRDAAPELHERLPHLLPGLHESDLSCNRRSAPAIMRAVNTVFEGLGANPALAGRGDAVEAFMRSFTHHTPHEGNRDLAGRVEVRVTRRANEGEEQKLVRLGAAADLVAELHRAHPHLSIGVLVRKNSTVARLLHELGPGRRNIPASGQGGGPLTDAPAVTAILDLLRLADHPDDTAAAFNVACSPLGDLVEWREFNDRAGRERIARQVRREVLADGLAGTIARWVHALAGACEARELRRALQLAELAARFDERQALRLDHFASMVEQTDVADSHPSPVAVMTIHKAKGLEFDAVVLPELDFRLVGKLPQVVVQREGVIGPIRRIARHARKSVRALVPSLESMFVNQEARMARESLSLLYVAMTRAKRCLIAIIDPPKENERTVPATAASILRHALATKSAEPGAVIYADGPEDWGARRRPIDPELTNGTTPDSVDIVLAASNPGQRRLARAAAGAGSASPSRGEAMEDLGSPLEPEAILNPEARDRGVALHALCEQVGWLEDGLPDEVAMARVLREAAPRRDERWRREIVDRFKLLLANPAIASWFQRGERHAESVELRREQSFARLEGDLVRVGRIDRIVGERSCEDATGKFLRATVVDFKSDAIAAADAAACAVRYRPQLEAYRRAAAEQFALDEAAVRLVVLFLTPAVAVELDTQSSVDVRSVQRIK